MQASNCGGTVLRVLCTSCGGCLLLVTISTLLTCYTIPHVTTSNKLTVCVRLATIGPAWPPHDRRDPTDSRRGVSTTLNRMLRCAWHLEHISCT
jgi:hypothetical protein